MLSNGVAGHNPVQPAKTLDAQQEQESSTTGFLKNFFYYYDPENGTRYKLVNSTATVAGCTAAGAVALDYLAPQLGSMAGQGVSIFERMVQQVDSLFQNNPLAPLAVGAFIGATGGIALVNSAYQGGLKPRTTEALRSIMNGLIHKIEGDCQAIQHYKTAIAHNKALLEAKKQSMLVEKAENLHKAEAAFKQNMEKYNRKVSNVVGELDGYLNAVFDLLQDPNRLPTYEEAISGSRRQGDFHLGRSRDQVYYSW